MAQKLYDLTTPVGYLTPDWMGHRLGADNSIFRVHRHEIPIMPRKSRQISFYVGSWHKGTHVDSETHHHEGGLTTDKMPLEKFYGTGVVVDMRYLKKWDVITGEDFEKASPKIEENDIVIVNTGWHKYWRVNDYVYYNHYPGMYTDAGEWLLKKKVKAVGGTWGATDHPLAHYPLRGMYPNLYQEYLDETGKDADKEFPDYEPCHQICSDYGIPAIEDIAGDVDAVTGKRCTFAFFPFRYASDSGQMVRVMAIVDE